jgi:high-affinity Fe2+/Pb2+ permease
MNVGRIIAVVLGVMFAWWLFKFVLRLVFGLIPLLIVVALILLIYRLAFSKRVI